MSVRFRPDACPGVFATHDAADGALARVRLPGGRITAAQLDVLAACAEELGDGSVHLTSRGNVQLRGLSRDTGELVGRLSDAGLLPAPSHERVRNYLASPLSGLAGGLVDVRPLVAELDAAVCAEPALAGLPGRFLFALDDGRADVAAEDADLCWQALDDSDGVLLRAGEPGPRVPRTEAVAVLVAEALRFLEIRGTAWRMRELPGFSGVRRPFRPVEPGPFVRDDGRRGLCVAPLFGQLSASQLRAFRSDVVITPWRSVVVPEYRPELTALSADSRVSACIGQPGCAKSRADVRADARRVSARAHFSGCERRCGKPRDAVDVVAVEGGYLVDGAWVSVEALVDVLGQKGNR
ncbi:precorrin-3B synthase [Amycolatopsis bartoniae]|uniref:Precorrin-3B synthase n=1 Tax=Amycolatopsis bartoniae TaxID=941986 RepID=A0A8H9IY08_9PSEU|nr:precorrin-3B synthase [Amycolatopsis bartoniae]MBB2934304.1 precorrin-3B synthase [Amycolatopsis bartoniae]TVT00138.1 precorrin-3B synthase [Amycolatopsis bartoniae]GHF48335.1 precorrin-3B synthase [Amycolatopsis bartoniae]